MESSVSDMVRGDRRANRRFELPVRSATAIYNFRGGQCDCIIVEDPCTAMVGVPFISKQDGSEILSYDQLTIVTK